MSAIPLHPSSPEKLKSVGLSAARRIPRARKRLLGGPQMVEISRDAKRVYFTNSLYSTIDDQFYPDRMNGWMAKLDVSDGGAITFDEKFFIDFGEARSHQVRLEGGDASTDTFCYAS
jgi:methanethiol oxidase